MQQVSAVEGARAIEHRLLALANPTIAAHSQRFFKTGPGGYGEGDRFLGIRVPVLRAQLTQFRDLPLDAVFLALRSPWHEVRLVALHLLVVRSAKASPPLRTEIMQRYLAMTAWINNWDLVDSSAPGVVGGALPQGERGLLRELARSPSLWERRIAIIATLHFIRQQQFDDCLDIAEMLLHDRHDLIHKAVGWMLREVGKRNQAVAEGFLRRHSHAMPRTMLRYAIERYPQPLRQAYLSASAPRD